MIATLVAALADLIVFILALRGGLRLVDAHLVSCGVGILLLYFLKVRAPAVAAGRGGDLRLHIHLLVVSAIAIFLRGAVLGMLIHMWGWPPQVAIVFAILATLAVALPGYRFSLATTTWKLGNEGLVVGFVVVGFLLRLLYIG